MLVAALVGGGTIGTVSAGASSPAASVTTLQTSKLVSYNSQPGRLTATVKPVVHSVVKPTGSVDFLVDGSWWWTSVLDAKGKATLDFVNLSPGTFAVTAEYSGDANFAPSSSAPVTQTILASAPTAGLTFTPPTVVPGGVSRLSVSATNNTPKAMYGVALGVILTMNFTLVKPPVGGSCRRSMNVLYCLFSLQKGATKQLLLDVSAPTTPGVYTMNGYARNIDTMDETGASATLTVQ
jgi:hypothetical protein